MTSACKRDLKSSCKALGIPVGNWINRTSLMTVVQAIGRYLRPTFDERTLDV